jgi:crotonobetainyl-CoA:carnitine CoA-transferase CaiB-like acyl-CoA transferase
MDKPLQGIKVVDFTRVLAGPYATMILGDLGAEITKVEPLDGDECRSWPPTLNAGESGYFCALNRNKKAITLNLKDQRAQKIVSQLACDADVIVENFTPGVVKKLHIDFETLSKVNPRLVYCSVSGFGQYGPYRDKKAYDPIIQGMVGMMSITGEKGRAPVKVGIPLTDLLAALNSVVAIQSALLYRSTTGRGQYIDVALYDSAVSLLTVMAAEYFATGVAPGRYGMDHIHRVPARAFETKDGSYVQVAATNDYMYPRFCQVVGLPELIDDERFNTNKKRVANREQIMPILEAKLLTKTSAEWIKLFEEADLPCGPISNMAEVFDDPHVKSREMCIEIDHPIAGVIKQLGFPYKLSLTPAGVYTRPPLLGEHNDEILSGRLGYTQEEIEKLKAEKVI